MSVLLCIMRAFVVLLIKGNLRYVLVSWNGVHWLLIVSGKLLRLAKIAPLPQKTSYLILHGCIVWNAHNTVFGSKRSAICALAVYFVHLTRPKIQGLVSRDSIVDRQFVTAWVT